MASKDGRRSAIIHVTNAKVFLSHCRSVALYESRVYAVGGRVRVMPVKDVQNIARISVIAAYTSCCWPLSILGFMWRYEWGQEDLVRMWIFIPLTVPGPPTILGLFWWRGVSLPLQGCIGMRQSARPYLWHCWMTRVGVTCPRGIRCVGVLHIWLGPGLANYPGRSKRVYQGIPWNLG